jgi:predicted O-methyltransferase YrrM
MLFEFGTFDGRTTLNLALNSAPGATVYTLDLPRTALSTAVAPIHRDEAQYADKPESGARYRGTEAEPRIIPLEGDSGSFDFTAYEGKIDFVFIDASHTFDYVINDSLEALRLIGSRAGTIVWHDYGRWDGVTAALHELKRKHDAFAGLRQIAGTTLAVVEVGNRQLQVRGPG